MGVAGALVAVRSWLNSVSWILSRKSRPSPSHVVLITTLVFIHCAMHASAFNLSSLSAVAIRITCSVLFTWPCSELKGLRQSADHLQDQMSPPPRPPPPHPLFASGPFLVLFFRGFDGLIVQRQSYYKSLKSPTTH